MPMIVKVADRKNLSPGKSILAEANGKRIALFNIDGRFYAIDDICTHAGGSLAEGEIEGATVICPWHSARFDITNGQVIDGPADESVKSYKVHLQGDDISIEV